MINKNLDEIYNVPSFALSTGDSVKLTVSVTGDFEDFESNPLGMKAILTHWIYQVPGEDIKPFQLLDYSRNSNSFSARLKVIKKLKDADEFRQLCQDIADVLEMENIWITFWEVEKID